MTTALEALADHIQALTQPQTHNQPYLIRSTTSAHQHNYLQRTHKTEHPSLLDQLRECRYDRAQTEVEAANREAPTVPHIDLDAIDRLAAIEEAVNKWLTALQLNSRAKGIAGAVHRTATGILRIFPDRRQIPADITRGCALLHAGSADVARRFDLDIPALVGPAADDPNIAKTLAAETGRWVTWCRVFAGWQLPPWRPRARCPHCDAAVGTEGDKPAGLRVRLDIGSAVCLSCDATWSREGGVPIEVLAAHIKATSEAPLTAAQLSALVDPGKHGATAEHQNRGGKA